MEACSQGKRVAFYTAAELVTLLLEAQAQYKLSRIEERLQKLDLLIVDELGYLSPDENGVKLLFFIFGNRYERKSTIVTTYLPFEQWKSVFGDRAMTATPVDRLTHHCHLLEMDEDSYNFWEGLSYRRFFRGLYDDLVSISPRFQVVHFFIFAVIHFYLPFTEFRQPMSSLSRYVF